MKRSSKSPNAKNGSEYTGIKMDLRLYEQAKQRAAEQHQTYSEYVRQLIVKDLGVGAAVLQPEDVLA